MTSLLVEAPVLTCVHTLLIIYPSFVHSCLPTPVVDYDSSSVLLCLHYFSYTSSHLVSSFFHTHPLNLRSYTRPRTHQRCLSDRASFMASNALPLPLLPPSSPVGRVVGDWEGELLGDVVGDAVGVVAVLHNTMSPGHPPCMPVLAG